MIWECPECGKICTNINSKNKHNCKVFQRVTERVQKRALKNKGRSYSIDQYVKRIRAYGGIDE